MAAPTTPDPKRQERLDRRPGEYHLLCLGPDGATPIVLPKRGELLIGRDEAADVRILDPGASRQHARLYLGEALQIEDLGSANGTQMRDQPLAAGVRTTFAPGDAIMIGNTVLLVQRRAPGFEARRVWVHGYLETRLVEECARAQSRASTFALARIHVGRDVPPAKAERVMADALRPGDLLAAYGPGEYEALLLDSEPTQSKALGRAIVLALQEQGIVALIGLAFFPTDGIAPQVLVTCACERARTPDGKRLAVPGAVVQNRSMRDLHDVAARVAITNSNVLITGETGVGKEVLAETVHRLSSRAKRPFLPLNCAAFSESLVEGELFGYERGAFTGATQAKEGLLESASGGTLFLDEVGEMTLAVQAKLLRAIDTRQVLRIGALKPRSIDVRLIAATNRDLDEEVTEKRFREDLYFRLSVLTLEIPPLRERVDEIEPLATKFLETLAAQSGRPAPRLSSEALTLLQTYSWPGNIRELRNVIERACILCVGSVIMAEHLPINKMRRPPAPVVPAVADSVGTHAVIHIKQMERQAIVDALTRCQWNQTRAAELLGMPRRTFCKRLRDYGVPRSRS